MLLALLCCWSLAAAANDVACETYAGCFVSNRFQPASAASFVAVEDQAPFEKVFGVAKAVRDKSHRLAPDAFASRQVVATIHRGKPVVNYQVGCVSVDEAPPIVRYTTKCEPSATTRFACPLILSVPKGKCAVVQFVEDGKEIRKVALDPAAAFAIKCREADTLTATVEDGKTILSIRGGSGIGRASVQCLADAWPSVMVVRAYLTGLEQFAIADGRVKLAASVLSHGGNRPLLHLWEAGKEGPPVDKSNPYWMVIQARDAAGQPVTGLPPRGGWFEMIIPRALLAEGTSLELEWVDFYR